MKILIDVQGLQGDSANRGIGRYTYELTRSLIELTNTLDLKEHQVQLLINGVASETVEPLKAMFSPFIEFDKIRVWHALFPIAYQIAPTFNRQIAEVLREAFILNLNPDVVLIVNFFEGNMDQTALSIGNLDSYIKIETASNQIKKPLYVTVIHDLIPLESPNIYLYIPKVKSFYYEKLGYLNQVDQILAISDSVKQEMIRLTSFPQEKIACIYSAASEMFVKRFDSQTEKEFFLKEKLINKPYLFYAGGVDERKNLKHLVQAYDRLPNHLKEQFQLVIVCGKSKHAQDSVNYLVNQTSSKSAIRALGYVSDEDLIKLYNFCTLFIFPSLHEGFGLTVLEAMRCGAPVLCSNTTSLPEVMGDYPEALFNPLDINELIQKMIVLLTDSAKREKLAEYGLERSKQFSWEKVGKKTWQILETLYRSQKEQKINELSDEARKKIISQALERKLIELIPENEIKKNSFQEYLKCLSECLSKNQF